MAVHKKTYERYNGPLTPEWSRFLIPARYAWEELRQRRFFGLFFLGTFLCPIVCALIMYLRHNLGALQALKLEARNLVPIDEGFFLFFLGFQSMLSFFVAAIAGPGLVAPDLAHGALPLYLARPLTRRGYVLGKMAVLAILISLITWVPGLLLVGLQWSLEGGAWIEAHGRIAVALLAGSWIWILVLSLMVLAISAWVRWKPLAGAALFLVFFLGGALGNASNELLRTHWGQLLNLSHLVGTVWVRLFGRPAETGAGAVFFRVQARGGETPEWAAWGMLAGVCLLSLALLDRKLRAVEAVR
jgi:ABC-2 type transport system permease protein